MPNFLCIITDQQRADHLGCAGHPVIQTPNIDRLAETGVHFQRAYVNNPLCMPGRATLFTGLTPRGHGVRTNGIPLDERIPTMVQALADAGYRTHSVGKLHLRQSGLPKGINVDLRQHPESRQAWLEGVFQQMPTPYYGLQTVDFSGGHGNYIFGDYLNWLRKQHPEGERLLSPQAGEPARTGAEQTWKSAVPEELHYNTWVADRAIAFLKQQKGSGRPFFLWCSFPDPHHPYCPPGRWFDMYDPADVAMPTRREGELDSLPPHYRKIYEQPLQLSGRRDPTKMPDEQLREILAVTYGMVSMVDHHVGRILDALERLGLRDDTVVVFCSDHGDMMGDHWMINKGPFHFEGLLRVPFIWSWPGYFQPATCQGLASLLDFAPTILDLAGVPIPEGVAPDPPEAPDMPAAWPGVSLRPILEGRSEKVQDSVVVENDEDYLGLRLRTLITERYKLTVYPGQPYGELFDLQEDPGELHNRWDDPACRDLRADLQAQLLERLVQTDSALPRRLCHA